jgi:hypothetical protein
MWTALSSKPRRHILDSTTTLPQRHPDPASRIKWAQAAKLARERRRQNFIRVFSHSTWCNSQFQIEARALALPPGIWYAALPRDQIVTRNIVFRKR